MTRFFKVSILTMLCVFLVAGTAMAGTIQYTGSGNVAANIALEAMNSVRSFTLASTVPGTGFTGGTAINNAASITITPSTSLASSNLLTVTFTNAGFAGDPVALCAVGINAPIASSNSTNNATTLLFQLIGNASAGQQVFVTDDPAQIIAGGGNCNLSNATLAVHFLTQTTAQLATVSYSDATSGNAVIDFSATAANVANIAPQFLTTYSGGTSTIDYITGNANGTQFTTANNAAVGGNASINFTNMAINAAGVAAPGANLTVTALLSLQDSANWVGVKDVYLSTGTCSGFSTTVGGTNNAALLNGTVNLAVNSGSFSGSASFVGTVCVDAVGNTVLVARTITGGYTINANGVLARGHSAESGHLLMTWTPNGYQGIIPYINGSATFDTVCVLSNEGTATAAVKFSALSTESGAALAGLQGIVLPSLPGGSSMRLDLTSSLTPYTYSGGVETVGTPIPLTGVQPNDRFTGQLNISAAPVTITVNCIQTDTLAGVKRSVPVLQSQTTGTQTLLTY